jgi:hypothetical protein
MNLDNAPKCLLSKSYDLYLLCQVSVLAVILLFISNIEQHILLVVFAYLNILLITKKYQVIKIFKLLFYMSPGLIGFAIASFLFTKNPNLKIYNTIYLLVHFLSIIFISFLYTTAINFNSLIFYCLNKRWLSISIGFALIMVETTAKFVMQDWKKIFLVYKMRQYKKSQILKPVFLLLLNTISYAQDISINTFVRGVIIDNNSTTFANDVLTHTSKILWWQYFLIIVPFGVLLFRSPLILF